MQRNTTQKTAAFVRVLDSRNRAVRGLWQRGSLFYAHLRVEGKRSAVRVPLHDAQTVPQAIVALQGLRVNRTQGTQPQLQQAMTLKAAIAAYEKYHEAVTGAKLSSTLGREQCSFKHLLAFRPDVRLNKVSAKFVHEYAAARQSASASGRAVDLEIIALRNVLKQAVRDGDLTVMPVLNWKKLAAPPKRARLITAAEIEAICEAAKGAYGEMFGFFVRLLAYSGGREKETLRLRWDDIDWERGQLSIGRPVEVKGEMKLSKNKEGRTVNFSSDLKKLLRAMAKRRMPGTEWLFPSPRSSEVDVPLTNFNKALRVAQTEAKVPHFGFHHFRHYFISQCVMAGIDYKTISEWVGHKDGGVLIGKVYGHVNNAHTAAQARKLDGRLSRGLN